MAERRDDHPEAVDPVEEALRLLTDEIRRRLERHPWSHLLAGRQDTLSLNLAVPASLRGDVNLGERVEATHLAIGQGIRALLAHRAAMRPGAVLCLRCGSADCEHASPAGPREVFAGYGSTGLPRFADLGQLLLELKDDRVDRLYRASPGLVTRVFAGRELTRELLPAYRDGATGYRIHGQVVAGWYQIPDPTGRPHALAITLQVVSTRPKGAPARRFGLNVLGIGPDEEPLAHLYDRLGEIPWTDTVRWAQEVLDAIERAAAEQGGSGGGGKRKAGKAERGGKRKASPKRRIDGLLNAIARRLQKARRAKRSKTRHAQEHHARGDRPTPMALPDLAQAKSDDFLVDVRADTMVVLGERGRAHVFSPEGKHVTSVRYSPASISRRRERGQWRPARRDEVASLKENVTLTRKGEE